MVNPSQVVCFVNHAEWRFGLAPFWCVAPCRRSGARLAQWRPSALLLPSFVLALCRARAHICWMFILTHATALKAVSFKTVISTAPSSTSFLPSENVPWTTSPPNGMDQWERLQEPKQDIQSTCTSPAESIKNLDLLTSPDFPTLRPLGWLVVIISFCSGMHN